MVFQARVELWPIDKLVFLLPGSHSDRTGSFRPATLILLPIWPSLLFCAAAVRWSPGRPRY
jgi:hypothetical protein